MEGRVINTLNATFSSPGTLMTYDLPEEGETIKSYPVFHLYGIVFDRTVIIPGTPLFLK